MTFADCCGACVSSTEAFLWAGSKSKEYLPTCCCCCCCKDEGNNKCKQYLSIIVVLIDLIDVMLDLYFAFTVKLEEDDKDMRGILVFATLFSFILLVLSVCMSVPLEAELERRGTPAKRKKFIMLLLTSTFPEMGIFILEDFTFLVVLVSSKEGYDPSDSVLGATITFSILSAMFAILSYVRAMPFLCKERCECSIKGFLWCLGKILLIPLSLLFPVFVAFALSQFFLILGSETEKARVAFENVGPDGSHLFLPMILIIIYFLMVPCLLFCYYKNSPSDTADNDRENDDAV